MTMQSVLHYTDTLFLFHGPGIVHARSLAWLIGKNKWNMAINNAMYATCPVVKKGIFFWSVGGIVLYLYPFFMADIWPVIAGKAQVKLIISLVAQFH